MSKKPLHNYFSLFASCIPVKGAKKAIICDLDKNEFIEIPLEVYELLVELRRTSISELEEIYGNDSVKTILSVLNQLVDNDLGFWCKDILQFPPLSMEYSFPGLIHNSIIDLDSESDYSLSKALKELDELNCHYIQIRVFGRVNNYYLSLLNKLDKYAFKGVELLIDKSNFESRSISLEFLAGQSNTNQIVIHNDNQNKHYQLKQCSIIHLDKCIDSEMHCGVVTQSHFEANRSLFTESHHFNNCLNNKISIDKNGNICNCPSLPDKFGSIDKVKISDVFQVQKELKKYWAISKDDISVCKDCEFRYICTDCRAYVEKGYKSKPAKCNYDPYIGEWSKEKN